MQRFLSWAEARSAPVVATMAMLVGGLAYVVAWGKVRHGGIWQTPPDLWGIARSSDALVHGNFSGVYFPHAALTSPPGLEYLLAPVVALGSAFGLHPLQGHVNGSPYLWAILGPAAILIGSSALFAVDALARHFSFSPAKRLVLALAGGLGVANVVVFWGHPEDCAALALVAWAALAVERDGDTTGNGQRRAGWLFGLAIALQPLALLAVAPVFARTTRRELPRLALRLCVPSVLALVPVLATAAPHALSVLIHQPSYPRFVSSTPFSRWAPSLGHGEVAGGPTRLLAVVLGSTIGLVICRRRHDLATVLAVSALALALRVLFESELAGYYFWPIAALCLLLALRRSWPRFCLTSAAAITNMVLGNHRVHAIGLWWPAMIVTTAVMLAAAIPTGPGPAIEFVGMDTPVGMTRKSE